MRNLARVRLGIVWRDEMAARRRRLTSQAQVGYMFAKHPKLARKMAHRNISDSGRKVWKKKLPKKKRR